MESDRDTDRERKLCAEFAPRIRLYGLKHLRDEDRARDLVQAVLVAVIDALRAGRIEDLERIDRFVLGTARNLALRARDTDRRAEPVDHATLAKLDIAVPETSEDALDVDALLRCMGELDHRARTIIHLSFYREKSSEEIASVLATTAGNVRVARHRAVGHLRECIETPRKTVQ